MSIGSTARAGAGPVAFAAAAAFGARRMPDYRSRDEPISALASRGSPAATLMVPGFLALGLSTFDLARRVHEPAVRRMLGVAAATTTGAGLARCSTRACPTRVLGDSSATVADELHGVCSMITFLLWIGTPLVSAQATSEVDPRFASRSRRLAAVTLAAWGVTGALLQHRSPRWGGLSQRVMTAAALAWFPLAGSRT